jgi:hypothetical protein
MKFSIKKMTSNIHVKIEEVHLYENYVNYHFHHALVVLKRKNIYHAYNQSFENIERKKNHRSLNISVFSSSSKGTSAEMKKFFSV